MKITNKSGLPDTIVRALKYQNDQYSGVNEGRNISVTTLLDDPLIRKLRLKHRAEIQRDISDMVWALFGSAFHNIMEKGAHPNDLFEERLMTQIAGWYVNGAFDYYDSEKKIVYDYKTTSVWSYIYGSRFDDWAKQLNIYAYLLNDAGFEVKGIKNVLIFRDYSDTQAKRKSDYPENKIITYEHELLDFADTKKMILEHLAQHENVDQQYKCSAENRWYKPGKWAIHKPLKSGNGYYKNASKLFDESEKELAIEYAESKYNDYKIEYREGENKRCQDYCNVAEFCPFYQNEIKGDENEI